ncbi:branched-chain amino acid ABC transporter permease [Bradyrhizobium sp. NP1]|uniref:branched-chain amino acid ABC transporter permease n=1 Tax=Bradyrhizobium sp. NP1 TaxID=3049772 RepID=UPI0025A66E9E|nr:branched-chain amino acid ABC transporter permease [Bradyrhizobium sp. NP1]WJR79808.1 branched-chain amino acid ABC transporter permease [Bradyrhizobium sp. NP1]
MRLIAVQTQCNEASLVDERPSPFGWPERHRVLVSAAVLAALPAVAPHPALAINILIYGLFATGFNLLFGYTGLLSLGHAAFFGAGAYGCGLAIVALHLPWYAAILGGIAFAALAGAVIGGLAIRTSGVYFGMVTLALAQCLYFIFYQWTSVTGGESGLRGVSVPAIDLGPLHLSLLDPLSKFYFLLFFVVLALAAFSRILESPFGAVIEGIRENENRARASGYALRSTKWMSFVLSAAFCGLAGALNTIHLGIVSIDTLFYTTSGTVVMMTVLGGMGTYFGPFIGAALFLCLEDLTTNWTSHWQLIAGLIFIACVRFFPAGVWGSLLERIRK